MNKLKGNGRMKKMIKEIFDDLSKYENIYSILNFCRSFIHFITNGMIIFLSYEGVKILIIENVKIEELFQIVVIFSVFFMIIEMIIRSIKSVILQRNDCRPIPSLSELIKELSKTVLFAYVGILAFPALFDTGANFNSMVLTDNYYCLIVLIGIHILLGVICKWLYKKAYPRTVCYCCGQEIQPEIYVQEEKDLLKEAVHREIQKEQEESKQGDDNG